MIRGELLLHGCAPARESPAVSTSGTVVGAATTAVSSTETTSTNAPISVLAIPIAGRKTTGAWAGGLDHATELVATDFRELVRVECTKCPFPLQRINRIESGRPSVNSNRAGGWRRLR